MLWVAHQGGIKGSDGFLRPPKIAQHLTEPRVSEFRVVLSPDGFARNTLCCIERFVTAGHSKTIERRGAIGLLGIGVGEIWIQLGRVHRLRQRFDKSLRFIAKIRVAALLVSIIFLRIYSAAPLFGWWGWIRRDHGKQTVCDQILTGLKTFLRQIKTPGPDLLLSGSI